VLKKFDSLSFCGGGETGEPAKIGLREQDVKGKREVFLM
jgi:hypothetical protein